MSVLLSPSAISASTWRSRADRPANTESPAARSGRRNASTASWKRLPRRLVLEQDVIARVELDELGAGNAAGQEPAFRDRNHFVVARVQDQRRRAHRRRATPAMSTAARAS